MPTLGFSGGAAMERALQAIAEKASKAGTLRVGFLEGATYPNGQKVAFVAAMNEYGHTVKKGQEGSYYVLPRPFFRDMIAKQSGNWGKSLGNLARLNHYDMQKTLGQMGEGIGSQLQQSINTFNSVPLAPATVARKGFSKQLIDTAHMINSVAYDIDGANAKTLPSAASGGQSK